MKSVFNVLPLIEKLVTNGSFSVAVKPIFAVGLCLTLAACMGGDPPSAPEVGVAPPPAFLLAAGQPANWALSDGAMYLPSLRSGAVMYRDVRLTLSADGNWAVTSFAPDTDRGQVPAARLEPPLDLAAPVSAATKSELKIRRLHRGDRVESETLIQLEGNRWHMAKFTSELSAISAHDFANNPSLVARSNHVVALPTGPAIDTQRFPIELKSRPYRLCAEAASSGSDTIRLLDATGRALATAQSGEPCKTLQITAGRYTMEHTYTGSGPHRQVYFRQRGSQTRTVATAATALKSQVQISAQVMPLTQTQAQALSQLGDEEYWALELANPRAAGNYLYAPSCSEPFMTGFSWAGYNQSLNFDITDYTATYLNDTNLFRVTRDGAGQIFLTSNRSCINAGEVSVLDARRLPYLIGIATNSASSISVPLPFVRPLVNGSPVSFLNTNQNPDGSFNLYTQASSEIFGRPLYPTRFFGVDSNAQLSTSFTPDLQRFNPTYRYFPNGIDATKLAAGEVAMYPLNTACQGPAVVIKGTAKVSGLWSPNTPGTFNEAVFSDPVFGALGFLSVITGPNATVDVVLPPGSNLFDAKSGLPAKPVRIDSTGVCTQTGPYFYSAGGYGGPQFPASALHVTLETVELVASSRDCESCNLDGLDFTVLATSPGGCNLAGANFSFSDMREVNMSGCNLKGANLSSAALAGSSLVNANLDGAVLISANLNAPAGALAAKLTGAYLRNADLSKANATGVDFSNASFFSLSGDPSACLGANGGIGPSICATAQGATFTDADFNGAYLAGLNLAKSTILNASFFGANLTAANLTGVIAGSANDTGGTGKGVSFINAVLLGATFPDSSIYGANFAGSYVDTDTSTAKLIAYVTLTPDHAGFPGLSQPVDPTATTPVCISVTQSAANLNLMAGWQYSTPAKLPVTNNLNTCPNGSSGPCDWSLPPPSPSPATLLIGTDAIALYAPNSCAFPAAQPSTSTSTSTSATSQTRKHSQ